MSDNMKNMGFGSLAPEQKETILGYLPYQAPGNDVLALKSVYDVLALNS